jgi:hypothetical protein
MTETKTWLQRKMAEIRADPDRYAKYLERRAAELTEIRASLLAENAQLMDAYRDLGGIAFGDAWTGDHGSLRSVALAYRDELPRVRAENARLREALREIVATEERPFTGIHADWRAQIDACPECQGWAKNHPIQRGICNTHRQPLWARERHEQNEKMALGSRMWLIATAALSHEEE